MLQVENLVKSFGTQRAVAGVSFSVARGEMIGLLGPNGAGKSTTVAILCGLIAPDAGRVTIDGATRAQLVDRRTPVHAQIAPAIHFKLLPLPLSFSR